MKKILIYFCLGFSAMSLMTACDKNDEPLQENTENNEGSDRDNPNNNPSDTPQDIVPEAQGEAAKFVGQWEGAGPWEKGWSYTGSWTFYNDGTYEWYRKISNSRSYGKWRYLADKHMLITEADPNCTLRGWNWRIEDINDDSWVGTCLTENEENTFTYTRKDSQELSIPKPFFKDFFVDGLEVGLTINNYFLHGKSMKIGICYGDANESLPANFKRVYASEVKRSGYSVNGIASLKLTGLIPEAKYRICGFMELPDGTTIYGDIYKVISPRLPDCEVVYMGDEPSNGYVYLWAANDLNSDGSWRNPLTEELQASLSIQGFDDAIASLGNGWTYPNLNNWNCLYTAFTKTSAEDREIPSSPVLFGYHKLKIASQANEKFLNITFDDLNHDNGVLSYDYICYIIKDTNTYYHGSISYGGWITDKSFSMSSGISSDYGYVNMSCRPVYKAQVEW